MCSASKINLFTVIKLAKKLKNLLSKLFEISAFGILQEQHQIGTLHRTEYIFLPLPLSRPLSWSWKLSGVSSTSKETEKNNSRVSFLLSWKFWIIYRFLHIRVEGYCTIDCIELACVRHSVQSLEIYLSGLTLRPNLTAAFLRNSVYNFNVWDFFLWRITWKV